MVYLHGQKFRAVLEDDPAYFYEGRFSVNQWTSDKDWSKIVIDYNVGPYKQEVDNTGSNWEWDIFNFETGIIRNYRNLSVLTTLTVTVIGDVMDSIPTIIASKSGMKVNYSGTTYNLQLGANVIPDIVVHSGENIFVFTGPGNITIENIGGRL